MANYGTFYYGDGTVYGSVSVVASAGLPLDLSFSNPAVSVAWDYLFIKEPKNTTTWFNKSENSTTWTNQSKALTDWKEL